MLADARVIRWVMGAPGDEIPLQPAHKQMYVLPPAWETAVDGWVAWLTASGTSRATRRTRRGHVRSIARRLGAPAPVDVVTAELVAILGDPAYSNEHRRGLRASLQSFYRWCILFEICDVDPTVRLPRIASSAPAPRPAPDQVWQALLDTATPRERVMARLACEAGLRRAEVAAVHYEDLIAGPDGPDLIVRGKGDKQRIVPLTTSLTEEIHSYSAGGGYLFPGQIEGHISADRVGHVISKLMPPGWTMHKLRHRYASRGFAGTRDLRAVQEALGHASVATTEKYVAVSRRDVRLVSESAGENRPCGPVGGA